MSPVQQTFDLIGEAGSPNGMVFACPHAGTIYPDDMRPAANLSAASLRSAEDAQVDQLIRRGATLGIPTLVARMGRAYLDLNRAEDDRDPLLTPDWPLEAPSARARAGFGVLARLTGDGRALYNRHLYREEVERRLDQVHRPYHQALAELMERTRSQSPKGRALLIDWHSMPPLAVAGGRDADVVLGDCHGRSCTPELTRLVRASFEKQGLRVSLNQPYAGGWTTQIWGRPAEGFHALQIELNRRLYWNGEMQQPSAGWGRCVAVVEQVIDALAAFDPGAEPRSKWGPKA